MPKLAQANPRPREFSVRRDESKNIALCRRRVPAEKEIGRAQVKKAERMALHHLAQIHQPPEFIRRGRNTDRHDGIARPGRRK